MERSSVTEFFLGVRLLGRGLAMYGRTPRLLLLGIIPAILSGLLFFGSFVALLFFIGDIAAAATWFAADWPDALRTLVRLAAGIGIVGVAGVVGVLAFTAVTLLIGDPFYEKISERVEERFGGVPGEVDSGFWRSLRRSLGDSARLLAVSVVIGIPLLLAGFIPIVGQTVVPVAGALVGGWFLAVELVGVPFARRGMRLAQRRAILRGHRPVALGFGVSVFLCFLVPLGAVIVMPAAVAGGTLLARHVLDQPMEVVAGAGRDRRG